MRERLYRSRDDRVLAGVCGGIADWMDLDPSLVRIAFALLVITGGVGLLLYIIMAIVVPEEPYRPMTVAPGAAPGGGSAGAPTTAAVDDPAGTGTSAGAAPGPGAASGWNQPSAWMTERDARRAARRAGRSERRAGSDGRAGLIVGAILVIVGLWWLLKRYIPAFESDFVGPVVLVAIGVIVLAIALGRNSNDDPSKPR